MRSSSPRVHPDVDHAEQGRRSRSAVHPMQRLPRRRARSIAARGGLLVVLTLGTSSVVASASVQHASSKVTITLYNGQHEQTTDTLVAGFEKAYPNIHVAVRSDDEDTFDSEIVAEGARSPGDVLYTENTPALEYLQQKGLLAKVHASTLAHTPNKYNSPQHDWVGVSARVSVLIYNPKVIKKSALPTGVLQLGDAKYKNKIALAPGETDFQPIVTSMLRAYGKSATVQWLKAIKANAGSHIYADNETIATQVNRGAIAFGIVNQYYWYRMRSEIGASDVHSAIAYLAPHNPGYVIDVSAAGILKSSKHQAAAQDFLAYLVSKSGQQIIGHSTSFEYPIGSGVTTSEPETPFKDLKPYSINLSELGTGATAISLMREVQLL